VFYFGTSSADANVTATHSLPLSHYHEHRLRRHHHCLVWWSRLPPHLPERTRSPTRNRRRRHGTPPPVPSRWPSP